MKTRTGFVSNSSSSSFVLLGFIPSKEEYELIKEDAASHTYDVYDYLEEKGFYQIGEGDWEDAIGKLLSDDKYYPEDFSIENLNSWADDISEQFKVDKSRIKIYTGTRLT